MQVMSVTHDRTHFNARREAPAFFNHARTKEHKSSTTFLIGRHLANKRRVKETCQDLFEFLHRILSIASLLFKSLEGAT